MPLTGEYRPSTNPRVCAQVELYETSNGTEGTTIRGHDCVLLTSKGRRSGLLRKTPLIKVERDGRYVLVASLGGADDHPEWYLNIAACPEVVLRDHARVFDGRARILEGDDRIRWWEYAVSIFPEYAEYQRRTDRLIPIALVEPEPCDA